MGSVQQRTVTSENLQTWQSSTLSSLLAMQMHATNFVSRPGIKPGTSNRRGKHFADVTTPHSCDGVTHRELVTLSTITLCDELTLSSITSCDWMTLSISHLTLCDEVTLSSLTSCDGVTLMYITSCDGVTLPSITSCDGVTTVMEWTSRQ